jgi:hypothetical protein
MQRLLSFFPFFYDSNFFLPISPVTREIYDSTETGTNKSFFFHAYPDKSLELKKVGLAAQALLLRY